MSEEVKSVQRYEVPGAGQLVISCLDGCTMTGSATGLAIGVTWGSHGESGGVLDFNEVARLHQDLGRWLKEAEADNRCVRIREDLARHLAELKAGAASER